jgi:ABC-type dipeptide/oligopeptide/nickel transport system ATPase component
MDLKEEFGLTYVFISHDLNVVRFICDRVMVMYLGKVAEIGRRKRLRRCPASLFDGAPLLHALDRPRQPHAARAARRRSAQPDRPAARLPLPHPLQVRASRSVLASEPPLPARSNRATRRLPHGHPGSGHSRAPDARAAPNRRAPMAGRRRPLSQPGQARGHLHRRARHRCARSTASIWWSPSGETLALIGESGSGKSVTLRAVMRLNPERRTKIGGEITVGGRDVMALEREALSHFRGGEVAMIFQEPLLALDPVYTLGSRSSRPSAATRRSAGRMPARALSLFERVRIPSPSAGSTPTRTRCPAACASAR